MPLERVDWPNEVAAKVAELEAAGNRISQILHCGDHWAILYYKGPGRPPVGKETRGGVA